MGLLRYTSPMSDCRKNLVLAADVGGTKVNVGVFEVDEGLPRALSQKTFSAADYGDLESLLRDAVGGIDLAACRACFAVAGPVHGRRAKLTNLSWVIDADMLQARFGLASVRLINDLEATAWAVPALDSNSLVTLRAGQAEVGGNMAVIAAGTGLGQAGLVAVNGTYRPFASEGGHVDFAPTSPLEVELYEALAVRFGHVSYERVLCGEGLVNIARFVFARRRLSFDEWACECAADDLPAAVSRAGLAGDNGCCVEALVLFVRLLGAQAGNLALCLFATGGVYVAGGIAPKIQPVLSDGVFAECFVKKGRMRPLLERIPVKLVTDQNAPVFGAALRAANGSTNSQTG